MKVCVTGSFGAKDIGDDAMVFPHLDNLDLLGVKKEDIWLVGHIPDYVSDHFAHPKNRCISSDPFQPPRELLEADVLLVTGGGTINTRAPDGRSVRRMYNLVMPFARKGTPIFMSGQTIGPLGVNPDHDALAKEIIDSADVLTTRDTGFSRLYIEKVKAWPKKLVETVDDAAWINAYPGKLPIELPEGKKAAVNVTVYTFDTTEKQAAVEAICHRLSCMGYQVILIPHHQWDLDAMSKLKGIPNTTLVDTTGWAGVMLKRLYLECSVAIVGRYHALVFAMSAFTPCVGMAGNRYSFIKQHGFADQIGLENMIVSPEAITDVDLILSLADLKKKAETPIPEPISFEMFRNWAGDQGLLLK